MKKQQALIQMNQFLGKMRGFDNPIVIEEGSSKDSIAHGWYQ